MTIERILCAVDGSEGSLHAVSHASALAAATGARLTLMHVSNLGTAELIGLAGQSADQVHQNLADSGRGFIDAARRRVDPGVPVEDVVELGDPADAIVGWADRHQVDTIVMGRRGRTPLQGLMIGSVSERVMRRAHCPVTVVR